MCFKSVHISCYPRCRMRGSDGWLAGVYCFAKRLDMSSLIDNNACFPGKHRVSLRFAISGHLHLCMMTVVFVFPRKQNNQHENLALGVNRFATATSIQAVALSSRE